MTRTVQALFNLEGRTALITGGSRGLGFQIAQALGEAGARVLISARKAPELETACEALRAQGIACDWVAADASKEEDLRQLAEQAMARLGQVDILVNNAGATWGAPAEEHPVAAWDKVMGLNVRGYFILSQEIARRSMIPRKSGSILNVASIAGLGGNPPFMQTVAYNTSKGAVINFTRALAGEWGRHGIRVNTICPGFFPSKMAQQLIDAHGETMRSRTPLARLGDSEDLKGIALLFASDAGKHITGQWMAVDGGMSAVVGG